MWLIYCKTGAGAFWLNQTGTFILRIRRKYGDDSSAPSGSVNFRRGDLMLDVGYWMFDVGFFDLGWLAFAALPISNIKHLFQEDPF
jgi:hypothetical protein